MTATSGALSSSTHLTVADHATEVPAIPTIVGTATRREIPEAKHYICVDNQTSWAALGLYVCGDTELFDEWPGAAPTGEKEIDGKTCKVFGLDTEPGNYILIFNNWNNRRQLPDHPITGDRDYRLLITDEKIVDLDKK